MAAAGHVHAGTHGSVRSRRRRRRGTGGPCSVPCVAAVLLACVVAVLSVAVLLDLVPAAQAPASGVGVAHSPRSRWSVSRANTGDDSPRSLTSTGLSPAGQGGGDSWGAATTAGATRGAGSGGDSASAPRAGTARRWRRRVPSDVAFALNAASRAAPVQRALVDGPDADGDGAARALAEIPVLQPQLEALQAIYTGLRGEYWGHTGNWTTTSYCTYYGVKCDRGGNVIIIRLGGNNLRGQLTPEMLNLPKLQSLDMSENFLNGPLPENLWNITSLTSLALSTNFISGTLSPRVANLTSLAQLHVADNLLEGTLPTSLTELTKLEELLVGANGLSGTVPQGWSVMPRLRVLSVVANNFVGPMPDVSANRGLHLLDVSWNQFSGQLVPLDLLTNLTLLRVSENKISGSFPDVLLKFKRLEVLYMSHNMMSCTLPDFPPEFLKQFGGSHFDILGGNLWACPIPAILEGLDPSYAAFFCGVGNLPFIIAGACVALFLFAAVAHTCPWRGPNKPKLAPLSNLTTYTPGLEAATYIDVMKMASMCLCAMLFMAAVLMLLYRGSSSPYECRYLLTVSAAFVSGSPSVFLGFFHFAFVAAVLLWLSAVRRHRRKTWGVWPEPETWLPIVTTGSADDVRQRRRCSMQWLCTKAKFAAMSTLIFVSFSLLPNLVYCFVRAQSGVSLSVKRSSSVAIALYTAVVNVNLSAKFAALMMQLYFVPRSKKHQFEVQVRLAGWFVVFSSLVSPWLASMFMASNCLFYRFVPRTPQLVPVDSMQCQEFANNGTCISGQNQLLPVYEEYTWSWDDRCPSAVLQLYGSVWVIGLVLQGLVGTAFRLIEDAFKGNSKFAAFALQARRYLCCRERDAFGTASESYLHGLVSRYSQIIDNLAVVVVFGSVYPMVVPAGLLALLGRTYADTRLVRKAIADGSHEAWAPQSARGLPTSAVVLMLVLYCGFLAFFFGLGMVSSVLYWAFLLPVALVGLLLVYLNVPDYFIKCCQHVSDANNGRNMSLPPHRTRSHGSGSSGLDTDSDGLGYRSLSGEELARNTAAALQPSPRFRRQGAGGAQGDDSDGGFGRSRSESESSLTGVGGRPVAARPKAPDARKILEDLSWNRPVREPSRSGMPTLREEESGSHLLSSSAPTKQRSAVWRPASGSGGAGAGLLARHLGRSAAGAGAEAGADASPSSRRASFFGAGSVGVGSGASGRGSMSDDNGEGDDDDDEEDDEDDGSIGDDQFAPGAPAAIMTHVEAGRSNSDPTTAKRPSAR